MRRCKNMVTKIDLSEFVIEVENGRNVIYCGNCKNYEEFVAIVRSLKNLGKLAEDCKIVI